MTTTDRELMQIALKYLEESDNYLGSLDHSKPIAALRNRLAQPQQEPVALETVYDTIIHWDENDGKRSRRELARRIVALYTAPPRREWVGLTATEQMQVAIVCGCADVAWIDFACAIEAKLKEKNA